MNAIREFLDRVDTWAKLYEEECLLTDDNGEWKSPEHERRFERMLPDFPIFDLRVTEKFVSAVEEKTEFHDDARLHVYALAFLLPKEGVGDPTDIWDDPPRGQQVGRLAKKLRAVLL